MIITRRDFNRLAATTALAAAAPGIFAPAIAQNTPLKLGVLAAKTGIGASIGEPGWRATEIAVDRLNKSGGIAGRKIELIVEEETTPKETIERFRRLVVQEKVDVVQGIISTGTCLAVAPVAEEEQALFMSWDGTTQDGVKETMPKPRYTFRSTDNECEAVMASLLAVKYFKGKFKTVAGINPDYSYGRNNWAAFLEILKRYGITVEVVGEFWPKVGTMDLTSHIAALKAAKPDLIFSSMLFADLPIFLKQGHAAGLFEQSKLVLPTATAQLRELNKEYIPEGNILAYNTMYFAHPQASQLQKDFVREYIDRNKGEVPHWVADRAYFNVAAYKAGVEKAMKTTGRWPKIEEIADSILGLEVESLGGMARYREDKIAEQMFFQGPTTNKNEYRFPTLAVVEGFSARDLQKPVGADFWEWIKTAKMPV
jgi:branched-chain amino acid transport system substrate-binding protein